MSTSGYWHRCRQVARGCGPKTAARSKQRWDVVRGLVVALEKDVAVEKEFTLGGAAVFRWDEHVPWFAKRYGMEIVDARLPESTFFEFDLSKIDRLLGYELRYDVESVVETAEAMRR